MLGSHCQQGLCLDSSSDGRFQMFLIPPHKSPRLNLTTPLPRPQTIQKPESADQEGCSSAHDTVGHNSATRRGLDEMQPEDTLSSALGFGAEFISHSSGMQTSEIVRLLPIQGAIKGLIFAAVAASVLASPKVLKRRGQMLAKIIRSSRNICCPEKMYRTISGLD